MNNFGPPSQEHYILLLGICLALILVCENFSCNRCYETSYCHTSQLCCDCFVTVCIIKMIISRTFTFIELFCINNRNTNIYFCLKQKRLPFVFYFKALLPSNFLYWASRLLSGSNFFCHLLYYVNTLISSCKLMLYPTMTKITIRMKIPNMIAY